jgi:hypothetical protein
VPESTGRGGCAQARKSAGAAFHGMNRARPNTRRCSTATAASPTGPAVPVPIAFPAAFPPLGLGLALALGAGELAGSWPREGLPAGDRPGPGPDDGPPAGNMPVPPAGCRAPVSVMRVCGANRPPDDRTASTVPGGCWRLGCQVTRTARPSWRSWPAAASTGRPSRATRSPGFYPCVPASGSVQT